jgi:hypothetical protein
MSAGCCRIAKYGSNRLFEHSYFSSVRAFEFKQETSGEIRRGFPWYFSSDTAIIPGKFLEEFHSAEASPDADGIFYFRSFFRFNHK